MKTMNQAATINEGLRAGVHTLRDSRLWRELAATALRPATLLKAVGILALLGLWNVLAALLFNGTIGLAVSALLAIWLWPPVLRWFVGLVARRAAWPLVRTHRLAQQERPPVAEYRQWWTPVLVSDAAWRFAERWGLDDRLLLVALAVIAVQAWVGGPAFARSLLASWFAPARIDESIAARRKHWTLLAAAFLGALALLQFLVARALGLTGMDLFMGWLASSSVTAMVPLLLAKLACLAAVMFAAAAFLVATAAAIATRWMLGHAVPAASAAPSSAPGRRLPYVAGGAALVALLAAFTYRADLAYLALGPHLRAVVAAQGNQGWDDPQIRQWTRRQLACEGDTFDLRVLHWAGVNASHWVDDSALACAIAHDDIETVRTLLAIGDDPNHEQSVSDRGAATPAVTMTPLKQAFSQPDWQRLAPLLVAHGATLGRREDGEMDAVQSAASAHCIPCLDWLKSRGASFGGTKPATPMTLWLDAAANDADRVTTLKQLAALGLSPTAKGADQRSPLHAAARLGDPDAVLWLLAQGADANVQDLHGNAPLDYAAFHLDCCNPGQAATDPQSRRLAAALALMPASTRYSTKRAHLRTDLAAPGDIPEDTGPWAAQDLPVFVSTTLNPKFWQFPDAAARSAELRARAHELGWKLSYESAFSLVRSLPPDEGRKLFADMPDEDLGKLLSMSSDMTGIAIDHGWWPEIARATPMWADRLRYDKPDCTLLERLVRGDNDPSPQAASSWPLVHAWFQAGARWSSCKPEQQAAIQRAAAGLPAMRRAQWEDMMHAERAAANEGL